MKLLIENFRKFLNEADEQQLADEMDEAFASLIGALKKAATASEESEEQLQEIDPVTVGLVGTSLALAGPQILEILGEWINWFSKKMSSEWAQADHKGADIGNRLLELSKAFHKKYTRPIEWILKKIWPDMSKEDVHKVADRLFHLIVAGFLIASGAGALKALKAYLATSGAGSLVLGTLETALTAIKSDEIWEFLGAGTLFAFTGAGAVTVGAQAAR